MNAAQVRRTLQNQGCDRDEIEEQVQSWAEEEMDRRREDEAIRQQKEKQ